MNTRYCSRCGKEKSLEDFPLRKDKKLGRGYYCKTCQIIYDRARDAIRSKTPERIAQVARNHQSEHGKKLARKRRVIRFALHKERYQAKEMIERLVNKGIIQRLPCSKCGESNGQGHHPDYSKPLEVVWLCQAHHSEEHNKLREGILAENMRRETICQSENTGEGGILAN